MLTFCVAFSVLTADFDTIFVGFFFLSWQQCWYNLCVGFSVLTADIDILSVGFSVLTAEGDTGFVWVFLSQQQMLTQGFSVMTADVDTVFLLAFLSWQQVSVARGRPFNFSIILNSFLDKSSIMWCSLHYRTAVGIMKIPATITRFMFIVAVPACDRILR